MYDELKNKIDQMSRRASVDSNTVNKIDRTVNVVFATENPVRMWHYSIGDFDEILSCNPEHIRQDRLNAGIPVLDNHQRYEGTKGVLGVVEFPSFGNGEARATLRFSKRVAVDDILNDIHDGILKGVSAGYRVYKYQDMNPLRNEGDIPQLMAIDWEPMEVSMAPVQADHKSGVREAGKDANDLEIISTRNDKNKKIMPPEENPIEGADVTRAAAPAAPAAIPAPAITAPVDTDAVRKEATTAERARVKEITDSVRTAGLPTEFATTLVEGGTSIESARKLIIDEWGKLDPNKGQTNVGVVADEADKKRSAQMDALVLRTMPEAYNDEKIMPTARVEAARNYRGLTLLELAKESLERNGVRTEGLDKMDIVGRAITNSTSDFPVLLEGTNRRVLLAAYGITSDTWKRFCATGSVSDFRAHKRLRIGTFSNLEVVGENQEYKNKTIPDAAYESIIAKTKGNIVNVSRQMIINDDLLGFTRIAQGLGRAAARSIEADVYALLAANPTMTDGVALFHATHTNIGTGSALAVAGLDADAVLMAQQMDPSGNDYLDIRPSVLLVPKGLGGTAKVLNNAQYDPSVSNKFQVPNIVNGMFTDIVDTPRLSGTTRYIFANPNEEPVIEVAFLDGVQSPFLESENSFKVDGMSWKVRLDYGVGAIGWKGVVRNAGA